MRTASRSRRYIMVISLLLKQDFDIYFDNGTVDFRQFLREANLPIASRK